MSESKLLEIDGYSDDCGHITGIAESEYDVPDQWFDLVQDGRTIGRVRITRNRYGWVVQLDGGASPFTARKADP